MDSDFLCTQALTDDLDETYVEDDDSNDEETKKEVATLKVLPNKKLGIPAIEFPIYNGENIVGRHTGCNVSIPWSVAMSKKHAIIEADSDSCFLSDCGSSNKTRIGKVKLKPNVKYGLRGGDKIIFGNVQCVFVQKTTDALEETTFVLAVNQTKAHASSVYETPSKNNERILATDTPDQSMSVTANIHMTLNESSATIPESQPVSLNTPVSVKQLRKGNVQTISSPLPFDVENVVSTSSKITTDQCFQGNTSVMATSSGNHNVDISHVTDSDVDTDFHMDSDTDVEDNQNSETNSKQLVESSILEDIYEADTIELTSGKSSQVESSEKALEMNELADSGTDYDDGEEVSMLQNLCAEETQRYALLPMQVSTPNIATKSKESKSSSDSDDEAIMSIDLNSISSPSTSNSKFDHQEDLTIDDQKPGCSVAQEKNVESDSPDSFGDFCTQAFPRKGDAHILEDTMGMLETQAFARSPVNQEEDVDDSMLYDMPTQAFPGCMESPCVQIKQKIDKVAPVQEDMPEVGDSIIYDDAPSITIVNPKLKGIKSTSTDPGSKKEKSVIQEQASLIPKYVGENPNIGGQARRSVELSETSFRLANTDTGENSGFSVVASQVGSRQSQPPNDTDAFDTAPLVERLEDCKILPIESNSTPLLVRSDGATSSLARKEENLSRNSLIQTMEDFKASSEHNEFKDDAKSTSVSSDPLNNQDENMSEDEATQTYSVRLNSENNIVKTSSSAIIENTAGYSSKQDADAKNSHVLNNPPIKEKFLLTDTCVSLKTKKTDSEAVQQDSGNKDKSSECLNKKESENISTEEYETTSGINFSEKTDENKNVIKNLPSQIAEVVNSDLINSIITSKTDSPSSLNDPSVIKKRDSQHNEEDDLEATQTYVLKQDTLIIQDDLDATQAYVNTSYSSVRRRKKSIQHPGDVSATHGSSKTEEENQAYVPNASIRESDKDNKIIPDNLPASSIASSRHQDQTQSKVKPTRKLRKTAEVLQNTGSSLKDQDATQSYVKVKPTRKLSKNAKVLQNTESSLEDQDATQSYVKVKPTQKLSKNAKVLQNTESSLEDQDATQSYVTVNVKPTQNVKEIAENLIDDQDATQSYVSVEPAQCSRILNKKSSASSSMNDVDATQAYVTTLPSDVTDEGSSKDVLHLEETSAGSSKAPSRRGKKIHPKELKSNVNSVDSAKISLNIISEPVRKSRRTSRKDYANLSKGISIQEDGESSSKIQNKSPTSKKKTKEQNTKRASNASNPSSNITNNNEKDDDSPVVKTKRTRNTTKASKSTTPKMINSKLKTSTKKGKEMTRVLPILLKEENKEGEESLSTSKTSGTRNSARDFESVSSVPTEPKPSTRRKRGRKIIKVKEEIVMTNVEDNTDTVSIISDNSSLPGTSNAKLTGRRKRRNTSLSSTTSSATSNKELRTPAKKAKSEELSSDLQHAAAMALRPKRSKPKVMFTGVLDITAETIVTNLGGSLVTDVDQCTHLVTEKMRRTIKFLCAVTKGLYIVTLDWLHMSAQHNKFLPEDNFELKEDMPSPNGETLQGKYNFTLSETLKKASASASPLFHGFSVYVTKNVAPPPDQMHQILICAGAVILPKMPPANRVEVSPNTIVVATPGDKKACAKAIQAGCRIVRNEFVLTGILRHSLDFVENSLFDSCATQNNTSVTESNEHGVSTSQKKD